MKRSPATVWLLILSFTLLFVGPAAVAAETLEQLLAQAQAFRAKRDFSAAATTLEKAVAQQPGKGSLHLQYTEMLEAADQFEVAKGAYRKALKAIAAGDPDKTELSYRLLQLLSLRLGEPEEAKDLLAALPAKSAVHTDAQGCLAYGRGRYQEALRYFEQAQKQTTDLDLGARIGYHIALTQNQLGDPDLTMLALFNAINQAQSFSVRHQIETFFNQLKGLTP